MQCFFLLSSDPEDFAQTLTNGGAAALRDQPLASSILPFMRGEGRCRVLGARRTVGSGLTCPNGVRIAARASHRLRDHLARAPLPAPPMVVVCGTGAGAYAMLKRPHAFGPRQAAARPQRRATASARISERTIGIVQRVANTDFIQQRSIR
jgi:hypothetical protein